MKQQQFICIQPQCIYNGNILNLEEAKVHISENHDIRETTEFIKEIKQQIKQKREQLFIELICKINKMIFENEDNILNFIVHSFDKTTHDIEEAKQKFQLFEQGYFNYQINGNAEFIDLFQIYELSKKQDLYFVDEYYQIEKICLECTQKIHQTLQQMTNQILGIVNKIQEKNLIQQTDYDILSALSQEQELNIQDNQSSNLISSSFDQKPLIDSNYIISQYSVSQSEILQNDGIPEIFSANSQQQQDKIEKEIVQKNFEQENIIHQTDHKNQKPENKDFNFQNNISVSQIFQNIEIQKKPAPLRGYKQRQENDRKNERLQLSLEQQKQLDNVQLDEILAQTIRKFDSSKSDKNIKNQPKSSFIVCEQQCLAIVEGAFNLNQNYQIHLNLKKYNQDNDYDIQFGMIEKNNVEETQFKYFYGIDKSGKLYPENINSIINLNIDQYYLLTYRKEFRSLIIVNMGDQTQQVRIHIPESQSEFVFFLNIYNMKVFLV